METEMIEIKKIENCCTSVDTLIELDKRAQEDIKNNTHNIEQHEVLTIIREFIRCKNDIEYIKKKYIPRYLVQGICNDLQQLINRYSKIKE